MKALLRRLRLGERPLRLRRGRGDLAAMMPHQRSQRVGTSGTTLQRQGLGRWLLLATAIGQIVAIPLASFQGSASDPPIVPPSPFFAVWSVVVAGCLAVAAWGFPRARASRPPYTEIQLPLTLAQVGFMVWLFAASAAPVLTVPIFVMMLVALGRCLRTLIVRPAADRVTRLVLGVTLGVYAGWATAAVWINAATILLAGPLVRSETAALLVQGGALAAATLAACVGIALYRGQGAYVGTLAWAFVGVIVATAMARQPGLLLLAAGGLLAIAVATRRARGAVEQGLP